MTTLAAQPQVRRFTREEYHLMAAQGLFDGQNVQLIEGKIIEMPPQGHAHTKAVFRLAEFLRAAFAAEHWVREEKPLTVARGSEPEPDVAVVSGSDRDYSDHPTTAILVAEVSDSSLWLDRDKVKLYAAAGIEEYWLVNLPEAQVEVYRLPVRAEERYERKTIVKVGDTISPLARPQASLNVAELFQ